MQTGHLTLIFKCDSGAEPPPLIGAALRAIQDLVLQLHINLILLEFCIHLIQTILLSEVEITLNEDNHCLHRDENTTLIKQTGATKANGPHDIHTIRPYLSLPLSFLNQIGIFFFDHPRPDQRYLSSPSTGKSPRGLRSRGFAYV